MGETETVSVKRDGKVNFKLIHNKILAVHVKPVSKQQWGRFITVLLESG